MANPFPFVAGDVLTAAELNGIGEATAYTPVFTNLTVGNGTVTFKFMQVQKLVFVQGGIQFGSTTSISGNVNLTLPVTAATTINFPPIGTAQFNDQGTARILGVVLFDSTTTAGVRLVAVSGTFIANGTLNATTPFTFTTGDHVLCSFTYEAA